MMPQNRSTYLDRRIVLVTHTLHEPHAQKKKCANKKKAREKKKRNQKTNNELADNDLAPDRPRVKELEALNDLGLFGLGSFIIILGPFVGALHNAVQSRQLSRLEKHTRNTRSIAVGRNFKRVKQR